ncbi:MAG: biopolymer transporter ExbD [Calditrichae bacterium]|nr:biopolymer transporter ExbD [Calditrichota bacterium]MCB9058812.1 biopolymer transporter ExbD [Calditrichia bacterium]
MQFKKKSKIKLAIPTASMPDIIFMLLIFFMVATVMRTYSGLKVKLPDAAKIQKLDVSKRHISTIWVDKDNNIVMDDITVKDVKNLRNLAYQKRVDDPQLVISLKGDQLAKMGVINDVHQELRKGSALNVNYSAMPSGEF